MRADLNRNTFFSGSQSQFFGKQCDEVIRNSDLRKPLIDFLVWGEETVDLAFIFTMFREKCGNCDFCVENATRKLI